MMGISEEPEMNRKTSIGECLFRAYLGMVEGLARIGSELEFYFPTDEVSEQKYRQNNNQLGE